MGEYERYIDRLKKMKVEFNDRKMHSRIETEVNGQARRLKLAVEGALALLLISFVLYFNVSPYLFGRSATMSEYVFQQENANGDPVMNYIFSY